MSDASELAEITRPTERAMKAAVEMEIHAVCSTSTVGKGAAIERHFPAYDDLLEALRPFADADLYRPNYPDEITITCKVIGTHYQLDLTVGQFKAARAALAAAEASAAP